MADDAESVQVRLQQLALHELIALDDDVAWMVDSDIKLGQQRSELPAGNLQAAAEGGEITNEIDVATEIQVELPREPPKLRGGVTYHKKKRKWAAHLIYKVPPGVQVHGRKKKRPAVQFLGNFDTADQAQRAHDDAMLELGRMQQLPSVEGKLNFFQSDVVGEQ